MKLAIRGSQGLYLANGPPEFEPDATFEKEISSKCKVSYSGGAKAAPDSGKTGRYC